MVENLFSWKNKKILNVRNNKEAIDDTNSYVPTSVTLVKFFWKIYQFMSQKISAFQDSKDPLFVDGISNCLAPSILHTQRIYWK